MAEQAQQTGAAFAAHERALLAERLGVAWSEDDGYEDTAEHNERLRRAFAKAGVEPGKER